MSDSISVETHAALLDHFLCRRFPELNIILAGLPEPLSRLRVEVVCNARAAEAAPVWRMDTNGCSRFRFHEKTWLQHPGEIFGRWLEMLPLIAAVMEVRPVGSCSFNLGDEGHRPGLAFDGVGPDFVLIPDFQYMMTRGYIDLAKVFSARALPWERRRPVAFWRGSTTGVQTDIDLLPRVQLCRIAQDMGALADVGFSSVTPNFDGGEDRLRAEGLFRDFVPNTHFDDYQIHIDIDGNSSSWPGFSKLHSGSPVIKVASASGYGQWYYDRLIPWKNYVPVRSDMSDLKATIETLLDNPDLAMRIGHEGKLLAQELSYEKEIRRAIPHVVAALNTGAK